MHGHAVAYARTRPIGFVGACIAFLLAAFFRGLGDTRTPLVAALVANALNVVLDYGLVLGRLGLPAWGVSGAGISTSIAESVSSSAFVIPSRTT